MRGAEVHKKKNDNIINDDDMGIHHDIHES